MKNTVTVYQKKKKMKRGKKKAMKDEKKER